MVSSRRSTFLLLPDEFLYGSALEYLFSHPRYPVQIHGKFPRTFTFTIVTFCPNTTSQYHSRGTPQERDDLCRTSDSGWSGELLFGELH